MLCRSDLSLSASPSMFCPTNGLSVIHHLPAASFDEIACACGAERLMPPIEVQGFVATGVQRVVAIDEPRSCGLRCVVDRICARPLFFLPSVGRRRRRARVPASASATAGTPTTLRRRTTATTAIVRPAWCFCPRRHAPAATNCFETFAAAKQASFRARAR